MSEHARRLRELTEHGCGCDECEVLFAAAAEIERLTAINAKLVYGAETLYTAYMALQPDPTGVAFGRVARAVAEYRATILAAAKDGS